MRVKQDEPFDVQPRANAALARFLRVGTVVALVLSLSGVFVPGTVGRALAWGAFGVVAAFPLGRVGYLGMRWIARGDYLFSLLAFGLLATVAIGGILALIL